jgi:hypothetical protein
MEDLSEKIDQLQGGSSTGKQEEGGEPPEEDASPKV